MSESPQSIRHKEEVSFCRNTQKRASDPEQEKEQNKVRKWRSAYLAKDDLAGPEVTETHADLCTGASTFDNGSNKVLAFPTTTATTNRF